MPENPHLPAVNYYSPYELLSIYNARFVQIKSDEVVWLRGIYRQRTNQNRQWSTAFDELRDPNTSTVCVVLKVNWNDRERLKDNSLVMVGGIVNVQLMQNGNIQVSLFVTRFEIIQDHFLTEQDIRRMELKQKKTATKYKNVKMEISQALYENKRPRIALVIAQSTLTQGDFEEGLRAARASIDFDEHRVTFTQTQTLCYKLKTLDSQNYTAIAIYRGGGIDPNTDVDKLEVLQVVASMKTPFISGVGHNPELIFLRQLADYWTSTPQGLGQFFSNIVEEVSQKIVDSRSALTKQIEKQFQDRIETQKKQNENLQIQLKDLNAQTTKLNASVENMQKENTRLNTELRNAQNTLNASNNRVRDLQRQLEEAQQPRGCARSGCLGMALTAVTVGSAACALLLFIL